MPYLSGSYLSGDTALTDDDALDAALSQATSDKQLLNYKKYYRQVASLTPAGRQNLINNLNAVLARLPAKAQALVMTMSKRTASYLDPRGVPGLGNPVAGAASTASTIAAITGIVATLGTIGLQVATTLDQRKQQKEAAADAQKSERINQEILRAQLQEQELRIADIKAQQAAKQSTSGPAISPDGSLIVPAKSNTTAMVAGAALTAGAAYLLLK